MQSSTFTVPISIKAHQLAQVFYQQQANANKAKQIYLNTLAVSVVDFYLRCMGIETDWEANHSHDGIMQSFLDLADLEVKHQGKLDCRPILPGAEVVYIPPEACVDQIGHVVVQLEPSLRSATLLGFTPVGCGEFPIEQLQSVGELLGHLSLDPAVRQTASLEFNQARSRMLEPTVNPTATSVRTRLGAWFENLLEDGWRSLESFLELGQLQMVTNLRGYTSTKTTVKRAKLLDLGLQLSGQSVALLVAVTADALPANSGEPEQKVEILMQIHPVEGETYLPPDLKLNLRSQNGDMLQEVQSRHYDNYIQLKRFRGVAGEQFSVHVMLGAASLVETFEI